MAKLKLMLLVAVMLLIAIPAGVVLAQEVTGIGTVTVSDDAFFSDAVTYEITGVTIPDDETAYEGWLVSDDGTQLLSTGVMEVDDDGNVNHTFTSDSGENLIRNYSQVMISIEPVPDTDAASSGVFAFQDAIDSGDMAHVRHLVADWPADSGSGIATSLITQLEAIDREASRIAGQSNTAEIADINNSMERIVNAIEGPNGANYADHDGDGTIEEVGDGVGAVSHANDAIAHAALAGTGSTAKAHGELVQVSAQSSIDFMALATSKAVTDVVGGSGTTARLSVGQVAGLVDNALNGLDADIDGIITGAGEAGARQAYREAQLMVTYTMIGSTVVTTTPDPVATPAPAAPTTGDSTIPALVQAGMVAAAVLILGGGFLMLGGRRSKESV
jgi:hypothetical protein